MRPSCCLHSGSRSGDSDELRKHCIQHPMPSTVYDTPHAIPRHRLTDKLYNTNMHNNTKRWLANYLGGRQSHVSFNGKSSHTRNFPKALFFPPHSLTSTCTTLPPHTRQHKIMSYANAFTITSTTTTSPPPQHNYKAV